MIKRFIPGLKNKDYVARERRIPSSKHSLRLDQISPLARKVVDSLLDAGYEAYPVGGCIRDALLGIPPKDFDVATSATPEQVKRLFRRSRIIGRRFRIVHVQEQREVIEVTTFRGDHKSGENQHSSQSNQGVLLRDNVYGSLQEDALRRDFSCNSLYFDIDSGEIVDFTGGVDDLKRRKLKIIGDPARRFREDPVRMLRAIRFEAKLGLKLESKSRKQLIKQAEMIREVSSARLFDEVIKLILHKQAVAAFENMLASGIFAQLFPWTASLLNTNPAYAQLLTIAMTATEERLRNEQRVSPFYLYATILWPPVEQEYQLQLSNKMPPARAMEVAASKILDLQVQRVGIPRRFSQSMRDTWHLQTQLHRRKGGRAARMLENPRFRAGYDFLLMREKSGEDLAGLGQWWTDYQAANAEHRESMESAVEQSERGAGKKTRKRSSGSRRPRNQKPRNNAGSGTGNSASDVTPPEN